MNDDKLKFLESSYACVDIGTGNQVVAGNDICQLGVTRVAAGFALKYGIICLCLMEAGACRVARTTQFVQAVRSW